MKKIHMICMALLSLTVLSALEISHMEPPNWWAGMQRDTVNILVYGNDFSGWEAEVGSGCAKLLHADVYPNSQFYALTLKIKKAGECPIVFTNSITGEKIEEVFPVYKKSRHSIQSIDASDVVYLLMPDRFADGDEENNIVPGHQDPLRRKHKWGRRGGDLQGVIDHLDYLEELGVTVLWMTPVYENNYINCYHGYTPTNTYAVDPFLGTLDTYKDLVESCHARGIKIIQDHIVNHLSPSHPIAQNPPSPEWINGSIDSHENCNYRIMDITDIYATPEQRAFPTTGWFAGYLADMNMKHPAVVDYWINHAIWWVETLGLDGIREDTYAYSDLEGLSRWAKEIKREYPELFIVGEIMDFDCTRLAYYFNTSQDNYLSSIADFGFSSLIYQLIVEDLPLSEFYRGIANDFIYRDPNMMLTFMDNHDMGRFFSSVNGNVSDYLNAFTLIFGMRGIPQIYYGNEIGMSGGHDPENRNEFPGGFSYTDHNAFEVLGRTLEENLIFDQFKAFTAIRKDHPGLFTATMIHNLQKDVYLVYRYDDKTKTGLLIAYNRSKKYRQVSFRRCVQEKYSHIEKIKAPLSGEINIDLDVGTISLPGKETVMLLLK
ncbi:MAG: cyclomaltodextrinase N-terminal domain-containing protein [Candidatus Marinimicrobia bacterium]|nr:cyclomaltodextrinase N-terminal domain-containing protein [Candidatus Neomarinimicrobiota bacterium]